MYGRRDHQIREAERKLVAGPSEIPQLNYPSVTLSRSFLFLGLGTFSLGDLA